jgi:hypothetical protein
MECPRNIHRNDMRQPNVFPTITSQTTSFRLPNPQVRDQHSYPDESSTELEQSSKRFEVGKQAEARESWHRA